MRVSRDMEERYSEWRGEAAGNSISELYFFSFIQLMYANSGF